MATARTKQQTRETLLRGLRCESMQTQIEFEWLILFENIENEREVEKKEESSEPCHDNNM